MNLPALLAEPNLLLVPGIYDSLSGLIATNAGAKAVYLSGASLAYTRFGISDLGLANAAGDMVKAGSPKFIAFR